MGFPRAPGWGGGGGGEGGWRVGADPVRPALRIGFVVPTEFHKAALGPTDLSLFSCFIIIRSSEKSLR